MAFRQDSWMTYYEACEGLSREIMEQISLRNEQSKNSGASSKASSQARKLLKKYSDDLDSLRSILLSSKSLITEGEFQRRQRLFDNLMSKNALMENAFNSRDGGGGDRHALFGSNVLNPSSTVCAWGVEESEGTKDMTIHEIRDQQHLAIKEQDKGLDTLYDVVVRQKQMAQNIGQEIDLQNEIIDDIMDHASDTRERLIKETRHVTVVDKKSGTCGYWVVIVILLIAIITVIAVPS